MAKVRVPPELRPPSRHEPFKDPVPSSWDYYQGLFKVTGTFRIPKQGEYYWHHLRQVIRDASGECDQPRVILERVQP